MTSSESQPRTAAGTVRHSRSDTGFIYSSTIVADPETPKELLGYDSRGLRSDSLDVVTLYSRFIRDLPEGAHVRVTVAEAAAGPPASAERREIDLLFRAAQMLDHWKGRADSDAALRLADELRNEAIHLAALPSPAPETPEDEEDRLALAKEAKELEGQDWRAVSEPIERAAQPPPASVEAEGLDVELLAEAIRRYCDELPYAESVKGVIVPSIDPSMAAPLAAEYLRLLEQREA